jgi:hypothetical protein
MTVAARSANRCFDRLRILDKGFVIDIYLRVSLVGIEMLTADARIVIASVDTYRRFAEAVNWSSAPSCLSVHQVSPSGAPFFLDRFTICVLEIKSVV